MKLDAYLTPEIEIIEFTAEDVITTSSTGRRESEELPLIQ